MKNHLSFEIIHTNVDFGNLKIPKPVKEMQEEMILLMMHLSVLKFIFTLFHYMSATNPIVTRYTNSCTKKNNKL